MWNEEHIAAEYRDITCHKTSNIIAAFDFSNKVVLMNDMFSTPTALALPYQAERFAWHPIKSHIVVGIQSGRIVSLK